MSAGDLEKAGQGDNSLLWDGFPALFSCVTGVTCEGMKPQTEELLYFLLWSADQAMRPTFANLNGPFESWAWRNGLGPRLQRLARDRLIEVRPEPGMERVVRLTEQGSRLALGGRDPEERWARAWDGRWRLVSFDVPVHRRTVRTKLTRRLRAMHLGRPQGSVWVSPDPLVDLRNELAGLRVDARALMIFEAEPIGGEKDVDLVAAAWDFERIGRAYARLKRLLEQPPGESEELAGWCRRENTAWQEVMKLDPLLPAPLCPSGYPGPAVWTLRRRVLGSLLGRAVAVRD